jgi:TonB family protein
LKSPVRELLKVLVERDPATPEFRQGVRSALHPVEASGDAIQSDATPSDDLWRDVFVQQKLPWGRFLQSVVLHAAALGLIWAITLSALRQQKIMEPAVFDRASVITYSPQEYLPTLDTGAAKALKAQTGDPAYAKQPIFSVPREANSHTQTIVVPPDIKLEKDLPLPNIVATGTIVPAVPIEGTHANLSRIVAPETQIIAPAPDVQVAQDRVVRAAMKTDVIAPPPEVTRSQVTQHQARGAAGLEAAVVAPPPDLTRSTKGRSGLMNIGTASVVAPAPQLTLADEHTLSTRGAARPSGVGTQPVGPPPSMMASRSANSSGRLIALGIQPIAPSGPVAAPKGNRRGTFAANPQGRVGGSGAPRITDSSDEGSGTRKDNGSLPAGLHVGAVESGAADGREMASLSTPPNAKGPRTASAVSEDKITDVDRQVFGGKHPYAMTLNMPNLNSSTGSWEIRFAEVDGGKKTGDLLAPVATEKSDPGYPLELIRANVHGMVTLYALIGADGKVAGIRILNSPDDRLDSYAAQALSRCKFAPAERAGKPVALEAVIRIPFRVRRAF